MAQYDGYYIENLIPPQLSFRYNRGIYPLPYCFRSVGYDYRDDLISNVPTIRLLSGETFEIKVISEKAVNQVTFDVACDTIGKFMAYIIQGGVVVDTKSNQQALTYPNTEPISLASTSDEFLIQFKVLPIPNGVVWSRFTNLRITPEGSNFSYQFDDRYEEVLLKSISGGDSGNKVWVKVNGEWKLATVGII